MACIVTGKALINFIAKARKMSVVSRRGQCLTEWTLQPENAGKMNQANKDLSGLQKSNFLCEQFWDPGQKSSCGKTPMYFY